MSSGSFLSPSWHRVAELRPRLRAHVQVHRHRYRGTAWYVVQDDLSGRQHRFTAAVYLFVGLLDGRRTVNEVWREIVERLADAAPTQDDAIRTLARLHAADLLQTDMPPSTAELLQRRERIARAELWRRLASPLSIRLPLVDPDRLLSRTLHLVRPMFGRAGALAWLAVVLPALLLAAMYWDALSQDFTDRVLATENLLAMAAVYPLTKLAHEAGHGFAIKRWGGAVHEGGVMLLLLLPVPYVDASAAAVFRGKWSRVVVGAAGMMTEILLAALALPIWLACEPGIVRSVAYAVMVTAGIGTVLFNANPLMRLDGYYILSDLIEMPNLAQRSADFWRWLLARHLFGLPRPRPSVAGTEIAWCLVYLPLSQLYRLLVLFGIGVFISRRFFEIGVAITVWGLSTLLLVPVLKGIWHVLTAPELEDRRARAVLACTVAAVALAGVLVGVPFPQTSAAEGVVWLPDASIVRAGGDGVVQVLSVRPGTQVLRGQVLAVLADPDLAGSVPLLDAELDGLRARLEAQSVDAPTQAAVTREELRIRAADRALAGERLARLTVRAEADGMLVMPRADDLPGRFVHRGDVLGFVTPADGRLIRVVVGQADIDLVRHHLQAVRVLMPGAPPMPRAARLLRVQPGGTERLPSVALGTAGGGALATDPSDPDRTLTLRRTFQVDLELAAADPAPMFGQRVRVRFDHGAHPLGAVLYRRLRQLVLSRFNA